MPITGVRVTVTTTATSLAVGPTAAAGVKGWDVLVRVPAGGSTVVLGGSGVTSSAGFDLIGGEAVSANLDPGETLYGIVASGTQVVHVLTSTDDD